ncbi:MAG: hypothetical protein DHS20C02_02200 [Micavibrio sp.]|nr:MAG: hypothetical protein DHS20C02_02200 [Micavibrio sp.]
MNEHEHYTGPGLKEIWEARGEIGRGMAACLLGGALALGALEVADRVGLKEKLGLTSTSSKDQNLSTTNNQSELIP